MLDTKLKTFILLAENKSYTETARLLFMSQPAVTQHIKKLEEHYNVKLIDIKGHSLFLTPSGKIVYEYAKLASLNERNLTQRLQNCSQPLSVGATLSIADYYLPKMITNKINQTEFYITAANTENLINGIISGKIDCAFIEGMFDEHMFESRILTEAEFKAVASYRHPLKDKAINFLDLTKYPLIIREHGSGTRAVFESYLAERSVTVDVFDKKIEIGSFSLIKEMLSQTDSISFMYRRVAKAEVDNKKLCYLDIGDFYIKRPLYFIYPKQSLIKDKCNLFFDSLKRE